MGKKAIEYFDLRLVHIEPPMPGEFRLATAAVRSCGLCGRVIDGMGGLGPSICMPCGEAFLRGALVGCVKWDEPASRPALDRTGEEG